MSERFDYLLRIHPAVVLIAGDLFNLAGAIWLAADLIWKEREIRKHGLYLHVLTRPHDFPIEVDGQKIEKDKDVEIVFVRRKARSAAYASALLIIGFTLLSIGHWIELHQGK